MKERCLNGWMDEWLNEKTRGWTYGRIDQLMHERTIIDISRIKKNTFKTVLSKTDRISNATITVISQWRG